MTNHCQIQKDLRKYQKRKARALAKWARALGEMLYGRRK